jgi:hypothetical protein
MPPFFWVRSVIFMGCYAELCGIVQGSRAVAPPEDWWNLDEQSHFDAFFWGGFSDWEYGDTSAVLNTRRAMGRAGNGHPNRASCSGNGEFSAMYFCDWFTGQYQVPDSGR